MATVKVREARASDAEALVPLLEELQYPASAVLVEKAACRKSRELLKYREQPNGDKEQPRADFQDFGIDQIAGFGANQNGDRRDKEESGTGANQDYPFIVLRVGGE